MGIRRRPVWLTSALAATATVVALVVPAPAQADVGLGAGQVVLSSNLKEVYSFAPTQYAWSVVAVQPPANADYDLAVSPVGGPIARTSEKGTGLTDFVAVNFNWGQVPFGTHQAVVLPYSGAGPYAIERLEGRTSYLPQPAYDGVSGPSDPDIVVVSLANDHVLSVYEFYLNAGEKFWANNRNAGYLWFLQTDPDFPATLYANRREGDRSLHQPVDSCTLYTASYSGWHAIVVAADRMPTNPGGGIGFALHRHTPGKPAGYCPVKNFPGPTPAGVWSTAGPR